MEAAQMTSSSRLIKMLMAADFEVTPATCTIPLTQPFWVNADHTDVTLTFLDDATVAVQLSFEHHQTLLKFGNDVETVSSMRDLCCSSWFPDLEQAFKKVSDHFDLNWESEGDDYDFACPWISYHLSGNFRFRDYDRVISLLLEIRSVLSLKECPS
ncbi:hypothetical protein KP001_09805 [Geomonas subterranea]|uniref:Uncharacterized protein n=1 Tax=Geomonas subterranea TaxID=2847989 RepID=A0ABX8LR72_9BACT|nr:hypothetical protein [Geomonas subterranea]QXE92784.1 hypothetical protein KP001_09805 [Geomonas subterranea]